MSARQRKGEKRGKSTPEKELNVKKSCCSRNSPGHQSKSELFNDEPENESPVKYEENSTYFIDEVDNVKEPTEIKFPGLHILSKTHLGISSILYNPYFIDEHEGHELFNELHDITPWNTKNIIIRGKEHSQPRLVAWYGPFPYSYSGITLDAAEMPECLLLVKDRIEKFLRSRKINACLNSVLLNLYRNGCDSVAWHSDNERTMGICPTIASVSLGATRKFEMKRKISCYDESSEDADEYFVNLTHGSLLIMNGNTQNDWLHRVPKEYHEMSPRINLTFRTVYSLDKSPSAVSPKNSNLNFAKKRAFDRSSGNHVNFMNGNNSFLGDTVKILSLNTEEISWSSNISVNEADDKDANLMSNAPLGDISSFSSPVMYNTDDAHLKYNLQNKSMHSNDTLVEENNALFADDNLDRNQNFCCKNTFAKDEPTNVSVNSSEDIKTKYICHCS